MPLTKLLTIALFVIVLFAASMGYGASLDMRHNDDNRIFVMVFAGISVLLSITSIGIWNRQNWARIFLIFILIIMMLAWTGMLWYWYQSVWLEMSKWQKFLTQCVLNMTKNLSCNNQSVLYTKH